MSSQTATPGIVKITLVDRHGYEWTMDRILDAPWLPKTVEPLVKAYGSLVSHKDEQSIELGGSPVLRGLVIRGARPTNGDLCGYFVLWPENSIVGVAPNEAAVLDEALAGCDVIGRLLLLLMQGGSAGIAAATNLAQSTAAQKAARSLAAKRSDTAFQTAAVKLASATRNDFDALLIEACVRSFGVEKRGSEP